MMPGRNLSSTKTSIYTLQKAHAYETCQSNEKTLNKISMGTSILTTKCSMATGRCNTNTCSINLLHLGCLVSGTLDFFERGKVVVIAQTFVVIINAQAELDHSMDAAGELRGFIKVEA